MARLAIQWFLMVLLVLMGACGTTVQPGERGLRWYPFTEGLSTQPLKDGFHWTAPWNSIYIYDVKWQSFTEKVVGLSKDDLQVNMKAAIILRPIPEEVYFLAQEVGTNYYRRVVKPVFLAAARSVVSSYPMVTVPEQSVEIASKIQAVVVENLRGRHLEIKTVTISDVEFPKIVLNAIEQKQAKEQQKEQKEFELVIATKDAEIARTRARGEGDAIKIRAEGEAEGTRLRAIGQAKAQKVIAGTLTPDYLRFKLYDAPNAKVILIPDESLNLPILINPGESQRRLSRP